jgi:hypothetical protein
MNQGIWVENVANMAEMSNSYKTSFGESKGKKSHARHCTMSNLICDVTVIICVIMEFCHLGDYLVH